MKETPLFEEVFLRLLRENGFWPKVIIGGALSFIPVINIFAFGYLYRLSARVRRSGRIEVPEWGDWAGLFKDGLRFAVVWLGFWLLPILLAGGLAYFVGSLGLRALGFLVFSFVFLLAPILFSSALYRYTMRLDFRDLLDLALIFRMTFSELPRLVVPALVFAGIFAVAAPLYGLAVFFGFFVLIVHISIVFRRIEQNRKVVF